MKINKINESWAIADKAMLMPKEEDFIFLIDCLNEYKSKGDESRIQYTPTGLWLCLSDNIYLLIRATLALSLLSKNYGDVCKVFRTELLNCLQTNIDKEDMKEAVDYFTQNVNKYMSIYGKYINSIKPEDIKESLNEMLTEASALTNEDKMDLWHQGKRGFNVKAASDSKLFDDYEICIQKGYTKEADILADEGAYRGLWWGKNHQANKIFSQGQVRQQNKQPATKVQPSNQVPAYDVFRLELLDFSKDELETCKKAIDSGKQPKAFYSELLNEIEHEDPVGYRAAYGDLITARKAKVLTNLIYSCMLNDKNYINVFKGIAETLLSGTNVAKSCKAAIANNVILNHLTSWLNEINNGKLTEAAEKHEQLNPKLWDDEDLKPEVTEKINLIVDEFLKGLEEDNIKIDVKDIIIVGSNCSYNYTDDSDLDLHLVVDTANLENSDLYNKLYSAYRTLFNKKIDIEFYGIPVEIFVETDDMPKLYNGVYSVMNNQWIEKPVAEDIPEIDQEALDKEVAIWEQRYEDLLAEIDKELDEALARGDTEAARNIQRQIDYFEDKEDSDYYNQNKYDDQIEELEQRLEESAESHINPIIDEINNYIEDLYELRKTGMAEEGQYGIKNLTFKEIRNKGYLDELKDLKNELISKELSLEEAAKDLDEEIEEADIPDVLQYIVGQYNYNLDPDIGLFKIQHVKAHELNYIVTQLYDLPNLEWLKKTVENDDFNKLVLLGNRQPEEKLYTITGQIN